MLGWSLFEDGDLDGARAAYERARQHRPDEPEVVALGGALASAVGDIEVGLAAFARAFELDPENTRYLIHAAEVTLYSRDDPEAAIALCDRVLDETAEEDDLIDAVLIKTEALVSLGDHDDEAREVLAELEGCAMGDPALLCQAGDLALALDELVAAERAYAAALDLEPDWADAHHGQGMVHEARGDKERAVLAWLRTRELDLAALAELDEDELAAPWHLSEDEFAEVAERALAELPENARAYLENVPILIDQVPSEDLVREGTDPRLLGLFLGVPMPEKSHMDGSSQAGLDAVFLFQRNLERASRSREHLHEEIRITVLHETAHFFGLEEDDLHEIGLG
jgi:predicted Zn-dependent protease with MMP-like domain/Flp pilus assembly protein TadD